MGSWIKDQDYMKRGFPFTVEWTNKYLEAEKFIKSFHIYLSTAPGGMWDLSNLMSIEHTMNILQVLEHINSY